MQSITTGPGFQGQLVSIGATPLQLTGNAGPLISGVTISALAANSTHPVYIGQQSGVAATAWASSTAYIVGNIVSNGGCNYRCTHAGTSAGSGGPLGTSPSIADGTGTIWTYVSTYAVTATNGYELASGASHLFRVSDPSQLYVISSSTGQAVSFEAS